MSNLKKNHKPKKGVAITKHIYRFFRNRSKEDFWGFINATILIISVHMIYMQLQVQSQSNVVQTLNSISEKWDNEQMMEARSNVCRNWLKIQADSTGNENRDSLVDFFSDRSAQKVALYMELIGLFYKMGAVKREYIWEVKSWEVENYYCIFKDYIERERARYEDKNFYTNFENLYFEMQLENKSKGSPFRQREIEELKDFCLGEIELKNSR